MPDNPRIEELRRRVQKDPSSIAFAQLGEEYRRAGYFEESITTCRTGLTRHPGYLSARVTLGRSLIEIGQLEAAEVELNQVLTAAPENLAAIRGLADIHHRRGDLPKALTFYRRALSLARHDPDLEQTVSDIERVMGSAPAPVEVPEGLSFAQVQEELLSLGAASPPEVPPEPAPTVEPEAEPTIEPEAEHDIAASEPEPMVSPVPEEDISLRLVNNPELRHLPALEAFLDRIIKAGP